MASPKNVRVEYSVEATIKTGDFQNAKPGYKISADVPDGEHPSVTKQKLQDLVDGWMNAEIETYAEDVRKFRLNSNG